MALLFMDGFDAGDVALKWLATGGPSASATTRFGIGSSVSMPGGGIYPTITKVLASDYTRLFVGFAYRQTLGDNMDLMTLKDSGGTTRLTATSLFPELRVVAGSLTITTVGAGMQANYWYFIEIGVYFAASGGSLEIKINGVSLASNTGATAAVTANRVAFGTTPSFWGGTILDDFYICDDSGSAPHNTFLGDVRVNTSVPTGAGNSTQFTPSTGANYTTVDELPYSATDYVSAVPAGTKDTYAMGDIAATTNNIYGVQTNIIAKKTDAGLISVRPVVRSGGTDYTGTSGALGTTDQTLSHIRTVDPNTSTTWTVSGVNNVQAGMEIV